MRQQKSADLSARIRISDTRPAHNKSVAVSSFVTHASIVTSYLTSSQYFLFSFFTGKKKKKKKKGNPYLWGELLLQNQHSVTGAEKRKAQAEAPPQFIHRSEHGSSSSPLHPPDITYCFTILINVTQLCPRNLFIWEGDWSTTLQKHHGISQQISPKPAITCCQYMVWLKLFRGN